MPVFERLSTAAFEYFVTTHEPQATATPDVGRFMDLAAEVVHREGVIFISSAGMS